MQTRLNKLKMIKILGSKQKCTEYACFWKHPEGKSYIYAWLAYHGNVDTKLSYLPLFVSFCGGGGVSSDAKNVKCATTIY